MTPMPTRPAAIKPVLSGESVNARGSKRCVHAWRRRGTGSSRTAAMTRARAATSVTTGRFASRAIHSTYGCNSESVILDSFPPVTQAVARPFYPHFQRRNSYPSQRRHFLVAQVFDVLEQKCFTKQWIQLL